MGVDLGGRDVGVAEELLNGADVVSGFDEVSGERMAEGMTAHGFRNLGELNSGADGALDFDLFVNCESE